MDMKELQQLAHVRALAGTGEAKRLRVATGLSLSEIAVTCGVDTSTIWRWEQGKRAPQGRAALRYATLLSLLDPADVAS